MQSTQNLKILKERLERLLEQYPLIVPIEREIVKQGGTAYLVGGAVRDLLLGFPVHDLDIEVHHLSLEQLGAVLASCGPVSYVGKSFGVLKVHGSAIDWALPRTDTSGRKPEVHIDPAMDIIEALRRRDLTMNAMAIEIGTATLIDPFGGLKDLEQKTLRSPDSAFFQDDPLRFYRVMQFIGRFEMHPDAELEMVCKTMDISAVSVERIEDEFEKLLLKSKRPSLGIRWLKSIGRLHEILPELVHTITVEQNPHWHPEGSVYEHLMQTLDAAARVQLPTTDENLILRYAALCHDLGKVSTTILKDGVWKSPGHAQAGVPYTKALLKRITRKVKIIETVALLVHYHMEPAQFVQSGAKLSAYRRLAIKLAKYTSLDMLAKLACADRQGRNPHGHEPLTIVPEFLDTFLEKAREAAVLHKPEPQILHGRDIADLVEPGPRMGELLHYAYELQLDEGIVDKEKLRAKVIEKLARS